MRMSHFMLAAMLCFASYSIYANGNNGWQTIVPASHDYVSLGQQQGREILPACAFDGQPIPGTEPQQYSPGTYRFYFKEGKSKNLLIFFNGGGACWNEETCIDSLALANVDGQRPAYNPSIATENSPLDAGGIFNDENPDNPFADWSKVFLPYCTGDIHIGSSDISYTDDYGILADMGLPAAVTFKHRGFDNFLAVREWLIDNYQTPKKLLVTGSSAGGYGATFNFPFIQEAFPEAKISLLSDGAAGVLSAEFLSTVFNGSASNWGVESTVLPMISNGLLNPMYSFNNINGNVFYELARQYPKASFAQYTTAMDVVQVSFLKISELSFNPAMSPRDWALSGLDLFYFSEWFDAMLSSFTLLSLDVPNYAYYIGAGPVHTVLTDAFAPDEGPLAGMSPFFYEQSAGGVKFAEWLKEFTMSSKAGVDSVSCLPDCMELAE